MSTSINSKLAVIPLLVLGTMGMVMMVFLVGSNK